MRMSGLFDDVGKTLLSCVQLPFYSVLIMLIVLLFIFFMQMSLEGELD